MIKRGSLIYNHTINKWCVHYFTTEYEVNGPKGIMGNYNKKFLTKVIEVDGESLKIVDKPSFNIRTEVKFELVNNKAKIIDVMTPKTIFLSEKGLLTNKNGKWLINNTPIHPNDEYHINNNIGNPGSFKDGDYVSFTVITITTGTSEFDVMDMDVAKITEDYNKWLVKSAPENKRIDRSVLKELLIEGVNRFAIMDEYNQVSELKVSDWLNRNLPINHVVKSELIYLASPYSHPDDKIRQMNYEIISKITSEMVSEGKVVMSPISYGHNLLNYTDMPSDWDFWYNFCVTFLLRCDKLIVCKMPGWENSRGVAEEIEIAKVNNIPIEYIEPKYDKI